MRTLSFILFIWILIIFHECMFWEIPQEYISLGMEELTSEYSLYVEELNEDSLIALAPVKSKNKKKNYEKDNYFLSAIGIGEPSSFSTNRPTTIT